MEKQLKFITVLLIISIMLNFHSMLKMNNMTEIIRNDVRNLIDGLVEKDLEVLKQEIDRKKEDLQWISKIEVSQAESKDGKLLFKFNWNIKDYNPDSDVVFYCKNSVDETFEQLEVKTLSHGKYSADLQIEVVDGPEWIIRTIDNTGLNITTANVSPNIYEYYVVLSDTSRILTSETESINLSKLSQTYSDIHVEVMTNKENRPIHLKLFINENKIKTKNVILELHNGNKVEELKADDEKSFGKWVLTNNSFDKLIIRAEYEDEKIYFKEIWNKNRDI